MQTPPSPGTPAATTRHFMRARCPLSFSPTVPRPLAFTRTQRSTAAAAQGIIMMRVFYRASLGVRARTRGTGWTARRLSFTRTMATPSLCPTRPVIHHPRSLDGHCAPMIAWPRHHLGGLGDVTGTGGVFKPGASPAGRSAPRRDRVARVCAARDRPAGGHGRRSQAVAAGGCSGCCRGQPAAGRRDGRPRSRYAAFHDHSVPLRRRVSTAAVVIALFRRSCSSEI